GEAEWAGFENYRETLTDPFFWKVTRNTVVFGLACVAGTMIVGLCVALLLHTKFIGSKILGVAILVHWVFPAVAGGIVWRWMFIDLYGIANFFFSHLGFERIEGFAWFNCSLSAFFIIFLFVFLPRLPL